MHFEWDTRVKDLIYEPDNNAARVPLVEDKWCNIQESICSLKVLPEYN